jgi:hypothetical protein
VRVMTGRACAVCGDAFEPPWAGALYCSRDCTVKGMKFTIMPAETKGIRRSKMTQAEFDAMLKVSQWELENEAAWAKKGLVANGE